MVWIIGGRGGRKGEGEGWEGRREEERRGGRRRESEGGEKFQEHRLEPANEFNFI